MIAPSKIKLFIVEDEMVFQEMLTFYLHDKLGYQVEAFANGEEAILSLYKKPDIVVLDFNLLQINGLEVLKKIKATNPDIQVLLVTGTQNGTIAADVLKYGAFDYIVKDENVYETIGEKIKLMSVFVDQIRKRRQFKNMILYSCIFLVAAFILYGIFNAIIKIPMHQRLHFPQKLNLIYY